MATKTICSPEEADDVQQTVSGGEGARLGAIDMLRILAALSVLGHHWHWVCHADLKRHAYYPERWMMYGGYFGVILFFMISGLVILRSSQGSTPEGFVKARVIRLYPALWICCTLTWLASFADPYGPNWVDYLASLTMFPNELGLRAVDSVYWTLALEAKFYLLIWVLLVTRTLQHIEIVLWLWLGLVALSRITQIGDVVMADFAPFFIGGCASCLLGQTWSASRWALWTAALIAGAFMAANHAFLTADMFRIAPETGLFVLFVAGMFGLMLVIAHGRLRLPAHPALLTVGAISYPLYLLHKGIGYQIFEALPAHTPPGTAYLLILLLMLLISWVIASLVEPFVQGWLRRKLTR